MIKENVENLYALAKIVDGKYFFWTNTVTDGQEYFHESPAIAHTWTVLAIAQEWADMDYLELKGTVVVNINIKVKKEYTVKEIPSKGI
jgi:hypothetical protein